ncbi:hypothetical protein EDD22DRAFT_898693, partial [Suillus occidentalis]
FFNLMPVLFPYNRFTMTKLIKRTLFTDHLKILTDRQDELLQQLAGLTKEGFLKAQREWEKTVFAWKRCKEKYKNESEAGVCGSIDRSIRGIPPRIGITMYRQVPSRLCTLYESEQRDLPNAAQGMMHYGMSMQ